MEQKPKYTVYLPAIQNQSIPLHEAFAKHGTVFGMATSLGEVMLNEKARNIFLHHAKQIVPADSMKMAVVQPEQGTFKHEQNDALLKFVPNGHGHTVCWGMRNPEWLEPTLKKANEEERVDILRKQVVEYVTHYREWESMDIVNEGYVMESPWSKYVPDYIELAMSFAKEANPNIPRYYNGVFLGLPKEQKACLELSQKGLIDGIGIQWHRKAGVSDAPWIPELIQFAKSVGVPIRFSEVTIAPNGNEYDFNAKWMEAVRIALEIGVHAFTQWGIYDGPDTWNGNSLLFDRNAQVKSAYHAVLAQLS